MACISTHGGSGYGMGDYWDGEDIICGGCGFRIINPNPTGGGYQAATIKDGLWRWLRGGEPVKVGPKWPDFIGGTRGIRREKDSQET